MDQIVRLDSHQEALLEDAAGRFIAQCHGDVRKALKEMMVVNAHLNDQLERIVNDQAGAVRKSAPSPERIGRQLSVI